MFTDHLKPQLFNSYDSTRTSPNRFRRRLESGLEFGARVCFDMSLSQKAAFRLGAPGYPDGLRSPAVNFVLRWVRERRTASAPLSQYRGREFAKGSRFPQDKGDGNT